MLSSSRVYCRPPPIPKMPPGLLEVMDGLAREVLRHNPTNVYEFCGNHMGKLLEIRDGPSVKKSLTLEEKILRAQEKMRKKAQERRKKFDDEMKLLSNDEPTPTPVISEDLNPGPSIRAPVHHEVDLKNSSEFEISHAGQVEKAPLGELTTNLDSSNTKEIIRPEEKLQNDKMNNPAEAEICSDEIKSIERSDLVTETEKNKTVDVEPIFGEVETEVMNVEPVKESKQEIVNIALIDSPLQTITEASEENNINSSVILPTITIVNDGCDTDSVPDSTREVEQLKLVDDSIIKKAHEHSIDKTPQFYDKTPEIHEDFENDKSSDILDNDTEKKPLLLNTPAPELDKVMSDFVSNCDLDSGYDSASSKNEKPIHSEIHDSEILQEKSDPNLSKALYQDPDINISQECALMNEQIKSPILIENSDVKEISLDFTENENNLAGEINIVRVDMSTEKSDNSKASIDGERKNITIENITDLKAEIDDHETIAKENKLNFESEICGQQENTTTENKVDSKVKIGSQHENVSAEENTNSNASGQHENVFAEIIADSSKVKEDSPHKNLIIENNAETHQHENLSTENKTDMKAEAVCKNENISAEIKVKITDPSTNEIPKNEAKFDANDENVNFTELHNTKTNSIDLVKIEPEIIQQTIKPDKENFSDDFEKNLNKTEISLQKSDSTENTTGDSIVESDLSKTDDDSVQNNSDMDLETAAVTIQKVFRSFMFKSRNSTFEDNANDEQYSVDEDNDKKEEYYAAATINKERRPLGITRMDTVLQTVNEEKSLSLSTDDSSTLSSAATTIQAHVRGFLVRNRLNSSKTFSMNSLVNSHEVLEADEQHKNKTILNIHIVPEEGNYLSRDESLITSMELSLDGSPPSSLNLHPFSFDISERRKLLKREDAIQSVSPPSNNSGKLSEDSIKEMLINENGVLESEPTDDKTVEVGESKDVDNEATDAVSSASTVTPITVITISKSEDPIKSPRDNNEATILRNRSLTKLTSDEADVVTPYVSPRSFEDTKLIHSGEFHDVVLPTKVSRNETSAVREFQNVLVYFLVWNNA